MKEYYGNHKLYKDGAKIAHNILDILDDFDDIFSNDDEYVKMKFKYFEGGNIRKNNIKKNNDLLINNKNIKANESIKIEKKNTKEINKKENLNLNKDEEELYNIISKFEKIHIDDIIEESKIKINTATSILMQLEINGIIKQTAGKYYSIEK